MANTSSLFHDGVNLTTPMIARKENDHLLANAQTRESWRESLWHSCGGIIVDEN